MKHKGFVRIATGSACAEDRLDPAVELIEKGDIDYIGFDSLSENELSIVAMNKLQKPDAPGYDLYLEKRMSRILLPALKNNVKIVGNMGSSNPIAAAEYVAKEVEKLGYHGIKIAAIYGDNIKDILVGSDYKTEEEGISLKDFGDNIIAANAYIGSDLVCKAFDEGCQIVLTGRCGDSSLYLGALAHEYGWWKDPDNNLDNFAKGIMVGHLLECGAQSSGGYFADPPYKVVPDLHRIGFPFADVYENGDIYISKVPGSGGLVSVETCQEQTLYEIHDPENYYHAEVTVDLSGINFEQAGENRVKVTGVIKGKKPSECYKASIGVKEGYKGNVSVFFGGPGALNRAKLCRDTIYKRFDYIGFKPKALKIHLIGVNAMYEDAPGVPKDLDPWEVGVRTFVIADTYEEVLMALCEAGSNMSTNGMAGASCEQRLQDAAPVVGYYYVLIPKDVVKPEMKIWEVK